MNFNLKIFLFLFLSFSISKNRIIFQATSSTSSSKFEKLSKSRVLLQDDVMITLRVAKFFNEYGKLGFNRTDVSQPSTSYLYPIIISPFFFLPDFFAIISILLFNIIITYISVKLLMQNNELENENIFLLTLLLMSSFSQYIFSGWEFNLQLFFVISLVKFLKDDFKLKKVWLNEMMISFLFIASFLMRPDIIFFLLPVSLWHLIRTKNKIEFILPSILLTALFVYLQLNSFEYLTPTTQRLKASGFPDLKYSLTYFIKNTLSLSSMLLIIFGLYSSYKSISFTKPSFKNSIYIGVFLSAVFSFIVSDHFPYYRNLIVPSIVLFYVFNKEIISMFLSLIKNYKLLVSFFLPILMVFNFSQWPNKQSINGSNGDAVADQVLILTELSKKIKPEDGPIGSFYLGNPSFYMYDYEFCDFLGKADELIASTKAKGSEPGHNKWDIQKSLDKWNPSIVLIQDRFIISEKDSDNFYINAYNTLIENDYSLIEFDYKFSIPWNILLRKDLQNEIY